MLMPAHKMEQPAENGKRNPGRGGRDEGGKLKAEMLKS
jgi:hypothetical protein